MINCAQFNQEFLIKHSTFFQLCTHVRIHKRSDRPDIRAFYSEAEYDIKSLSHDHNEDWSNDSMKRKYQKLQTANHHDG